MGMSEVCSSPCAKGQVSVDEIAIANPLPNALAHYVVELQETLERIGVSTEQYPVQAVEGERGIVGKVRMLRAALQNPFKARGIAQAMIVTWPSLGLFDARLWSTSAGDRFVVLHDPVPIRPQVGFGPVSKRIARMKLPRTPAIVTHSEHAARLARELLPTHKHYTALHPVRTEQRTSMPTENFEVVVAGQFKPERDIKLLEGVGLLLPTIGATGRIYGRGWPQINGWQVEDRFLSESELDGVLASATVALIPYRRYYQSGVAIRALELGTMSLSPSNSFAYDLLGSAGVVDDGNDPSAWIAAIVRVSESPEFAQRAFTSYRTRVDDSWRAMLANNV